MELYKMMFAGLLICLIVGGMSIFFTDIQTNYPNAITSSSNVSASYQQLDASVNQMNNITYNAQQSVLQTNTQDAGIAAALGYLFGAISSLQILAQIPAIIGNFVYVLAAMGGIFIPSFVPTLIIASIVLMALISFIYLLMKVK